MKQQYFPDDEWLALLQSPQQAILTVIFADKSDLVSFLKEIRAAFQILAIERHREDVSSNLVKSLLDSLSEAVAFQVAKAVKEEGRFVIGRERISRPEFGALSSIGKALSFKG